MKRCEVKLGEPQRRYFHSVHLRPTNASILMNDLLPQEGKRKEFNLISYVMKIEAKSTLYPMKIMLLHM